MSEMIVKINGMELKQNSSICINKINFNPNKIKKEKNLKKLAVLLWTTSGVMLLQSQSLAKGSGDIWVEMQPIWRVFQDIAMVVGAIAIFCGLISMAFKRQLGKKIIVTASVMVGGCFIVPAALMLIAIIGSMINDVLLDVFQNSGLRDSVKVGG